MYWTMINTLLLIPVSKPSCMQTAFQLMQKLIYVVGFWFLGTLWNIMLPKTVVENSGSTMLNCDLIKKGDPDIAGPGVRIFSFELCSRSYQGSVCFHRTSISVCHMHIASRQAQLRLLVLHSSLYTRMALYISVTIQILRRAVSFYHALIVLYLCGSLAIPEFVQHLVIDDNNTKALRDSKMAMINYLVGIGQGLYLLVVSLETEVQTCSCISECQNSEALIGLVNWSQDSASDSVIWTPLRAGESITILFVIGLELALLVRWLSRSDNPRTFKPPTTYGRFVIFVLCLSYEIMLTFVLEVTINELRHLVDAREGEWGFGQLVALLSTMALGAEMWEHASSPGKDEPSMARYQYWYSKAHRYWSTIFRHQQ